MLVVIGLVSLVRPSLGKGITMWRTIWAIVAVGCALNTGCTYVWGTQLEKVVVEASIVADEFVYTIETPKHIDEDGFVHAVAIEHFDPQPEDLTSIDQFIALTFYDHTDFLGLRFGRPEVEVLECERITVEDDFLSWPLRLDIGFSLWPAMFEHRNCAVPYVMAFAEGCWPLFLGSPGLSSFDTHDHGLYPPPPDADARLRCFFYRRSRAWTVHMTGPFFANSCMTTCRPFSGRSTALTVWPTKIVS